MAKKYKFYMSRTSLISETFEVEADSEEEARELGFNGEVDNGNPVHTEWLDYADDEWSVDECVCIDPLYVMVKEFKPVDQSSN